MNTSCSGSCVLFLAPAVVGVVAVLLATLELGPLEGDEGGVDCLNEEAGEADGSGLRNGEPRCDPYESGEGL